MTKQIDYHGREGRQTRQGYKMFHFVTIDGKSHQISASTKEKAIEEALKEHQRQIDGRE